MLERFVVGAMILCAIGIALLHFSDHLGVDILGAILLTIGGLTELIATIYSVATRGLFGRSE